MEKVDAQYLVYRGEYFEVEFYYDQNGRIIIQDDYLLLTEDEKVSFIAQVKKLANSPYGTAQSKTIFNLEDSFSKIWAIKFGPNRFCSFFFEGGKIVITNAYKKSSNSNRKKESNHIKKATKLKTDYEKRNKEKTYYKKSETQDE